MAALSFAAMYILMYMMVNSYGNVYANPNQLYMTLVMTAAMMIIEMLVMGAMYSKKIKTAVVSASVVVFFIFFFLLRNQIAISDKAFLKSMIPHHGAAVLMCERNTNLQDREIQEFCKLIQTNQQSEIDWMQAKLKSLN